MVVKLQFLMRLNNQEFIKYMFQQLTLYQCFKTSYYKMKEKYLRNK